MLASDLIEELKTAIEEHGDMDVLVNHEDGWNYALSGSIEKIYDDNGRRDNKRKQGVSLTPYVLTYNVT